VELSYSQKAEGLAIQHFGIGGSGKKESTRLCPADVIVVIKIEKSYEQSFELSIQAFLNCKFMHHLNQYRLAKSSTGMDFSRSRSRIRRMKSSRN
jgi:hypothetical protein